MRTLALLFSVALTVLSPSSAMASSLGMDLPGVFKGIETDERVIALTFDACGKSSYVGGEMDYDEELIAFLREKAVPATLFVNERWIKAHPDLFSDLASDTLFRDRESRNQARPSFPDRQVGLRHSWDQWKG